MNKKLLLGACVLAVLAGGMVLSNSGRWRSGAAQEALLGRFAVGALNRSIPGHYKDLADALERGEPVPANYETYYRIAVKFMPNDFAGHYLLALCLQSRGEFEEAALSYKESIRLNPAFFWAYYNLGLMYRQRGISEAAGKIWSAAAGLPPALTLESIASSKLLSDCAGDLDSDVRASLARGYKNVAEYLAGKPPAQNDHPVLF